MIQEKTQVGENGDLLVETKGLTKRYGPRITAVSDLNLTVKRG